MEDYVELHLHALPHSNMIKQRRLLDGDAHVHDDHIRIVEEVKDRRLPKVQLLKLNIVQLCLQAKNRYIYSVMQVGS